MKDLLRNFQKHKSQAEFDIFVPEDDLWGYLWGNTMCFLKTGLVGNVSDRYVSSYGLEPVGGRFAMIALLAQLDHSDHLVKDGKLAEAIALLEDLCNKD
jgi:hypothetical protein